ncbi:MAG: arginine--tRNA ligase [Vulcanimicrobiaceae bacterium]
MSRTITEPLPDASDLDRLSAAFARAAHALVPGDAPPSVVFESPRNPDFGDFATNVALQLAKRARRPPQQLATEIVEAALVADPTLAEILADAKAIAGFINIRLAPASWQRIVAAILVAGPRFGMGAPTGERVSLEFGSANPTGPLLVVQGRSMSLGAAIANAMRFVGIDVTTEWIVNDAGSQIDTLGKSVYARYRQITDPAYPFPEDGYPGDYLLPIARDLRDRAGARYDDVPESEWLPVFAASGLARMVAEHRAVAERFRVLNDRWQSEREMHDRGAVRDAIEALGERGHTFESGGATWMRTTAFGDDKDRVLVRADGRPTYFAPDVAYQLDKLERTDRAILILGPDHHGYIARLASIAAAFGRPDTIEVIIAQQMTILRDGQIVALSKRAGELLTLADVMDEVGVDAARFFFVMTSSDSPMTFDLTLAKEKTNENPVFYVQYGHARIASIVTRAPHDLIERARRGEALERLVEPSEIALARRLSQLPGVVRSVAESRAPHRLARYAQDVASDFSQFYAACKVLGDDADLSTARLGLALATQTVLASTLGLLGVSAPDSM